MLGIASLVICLLSLNQAFARSPLANQVPDNCGHPDYECVPYFICKNGVIVNDGAGLIDIRVAPSKECIPPEDPTAIGLCCQHPNAKDPSTDIGDSCVKPGQVCLEYDECDAASVNTDGSGLIDIRHVSRPKCWSNSGRVGSCCAPPPIVCPHVSYCTAKDQCNGEAYNNGGQFVPHVSQGYSYASCEYSGGFDYGVCCIPTPVEYCPDNSYCVNKGECGNGKAYDYLNALVPYNLDGSWLLCNIPNYEPGVCCVPPILEYCPTGSECVLAYECLGDALVDQSQNHFLPYDLSGSWGKCLHLGDSNGGICCKHREPIHQCPHNSHCVSPSRCKGNSLDIHDAWPLYSKTGDNVWQQCYISEYENGVCCQPPYVVDDCPYETACVPKDYCEGGKGMDYSNAFYPYDQPNHDWALCFIHEYEDGVCCEPKPIPDLPIPTHCGVRNHKLSVRVLAGGNPILGKEANFGEFPWQVIIFDSKYTFICGATVISNTHVITGAHCVYGKDPYDIKLRFGEWQVNSFDEPQPYVDIGVSSIVTHEGYGPSNLHNDIAILTLDVPLNFQYHISPVCLPPQGYQYPPGQRCVVTGWGKDSFEAGKYQHILKKIDLPLVGKLDCETYLRKTRLTRHFNLHKSFLCAGGEFNKDACKGDGGGPLVCENDDQTWSLVGITAWGVGCGEEGIPGVYVDVGHFADWIYANTNNAQPTYG